MMIALPLLAAVSAQLTPITEAHRPIVTNIEMQASVTIVRTEPIYTQPSKAHAKPTDRQFRTRENVPLVEFY
jgi:hypothetical protein